MKKGQLDIPILGFVIIVIAILLAAPLLLKINTDILTNIDTSVSNVSLAGGAAAATVQTGFTNFWDYAVVFAFFASIIILLLSAFLVDVHPVFYVVWFIAMVMLFMFAADLFEMLDQVYTSPTFATEVAALPLTNFLYENVILITLGVAMLSAMIMYSKYKMNQGI
jgi:hypothetical protein